MKRRALIGCGSREWEDEGAIRKRLVGYLPDNGAAPTIVINGAQRGADQLVNKIAKQLGMYPVPIPYFSEQGRAGGHIRNRMMRDLLQVFQKYGYEVSVEAFDLGGPGTENMRKQAEGVGISVVTTRGSSWQSESTERPASPGMPAATPAGSAQPAPSATPATGDTWKTRPAGKATSHSTQLEFSSASTSAKKKSGA